AAKQLAPAAGIFLQRERRGTAHAVLAAREAIVCGYDDLLVVYADTPLIRAETLQRLRAPLADGAAVAALGFRAVDPTGYGRCLASRRGRGWRRRRPSSSNGCGRRRSRRA